VLAGLTLLALCVPGLHQPAAHAATTFTVNTTSDGADSNVNDGVCNDGTGNCTLRAAIQQANATAGTDTITFNFSNIINLTGALPDITTNMVISGPGSALLLVRRDTGGNYRIFTIVNANVTISGMTVANGRTADGAPSATFANQGGDGGGISAGGGSLTLTDVVVTGNSTGAGGTAGGTFTGGFGGRGGGIWGTGTLTLTNVTVSDNTTGDGGVGSSGGPGGSGGGIAFLGSTLRMTNCTVTGNVTGKGVNGNSGGRGSGGNGGGIYAGNGTVTLTNVTLGNNSAGDGDPGGAGGGLYTHPDATTAMRDCVVSNNKAGKGLGNFAPQGGWGGGIANFGPLHMLNCLVNGNTTLGPSFSNSGLGGGIFSVNVTTVTNSTISGNTADPASFARGGGIYNFGNSLTVTNSTVTGNNAVACCSGFQSGQGIHNSGTAIVRNSIVAGNGAGDQPDITGAYTSQGHNIVGRATAGNSNGGSGDQSGFANGVNGDQVGTLAAPIDPQLGPLANNGGPTQTHALLVGSPAINQGDDSLARDASGNTLLTDQREVGRFEGTVDIGAYELHTSLENVSDKVTNEDTTLSFFFDIGDTVVNVTSVTASSDNQTLVPDAALNVSGTGPVRTLQLTPAANLSGVANITLTVTLSGGQTTSDTFQLTVTPVNDAPSFTKGADQTVLEDAGPQTVADWATGISPGPNEAAQPVSFVVTGNTNASLFSSAPAVSASGTLTYTPAANANGSATITLTAKDDGGTTNGGQDTSAPQTFVINVTAVNDPPVAQDQSVTTPEDNSRFITFSATDVESGALTFTVVSGPSHGTLTGTGSSRTYTPALNYVGSDSFTFKATDPAGADSPAATISITVTAVNDAPVNTVPGTQTVDQNSTLVFSTANSNAVSVADVDAGANPISVSLLSLNGTFTLATTAGLTFTNGDGTDDSSTTFTGTLDNVNAALNGLAFKPSVGFSGSTSLQLTSNDQGFSGSGGARSDFDFINITVRAGTIEFKQSSYNAAEGAGSLAVTVRRTGDTSQPASVAYATDDGSIGSVSVPCSSTTGAALDRCDFTKALGRLTFAPGESEKSFSVLLNDDSYVEGQETALLRLSSPTGGPVLGTRVTATMQIDDDAQETSSNPNDDTVKFVTQHYHDFLNREPDSSGLAFWVGEIDGCGADAQCREVKRVNVSAAFFVSIEFQQTGFLVYRLDKVAFGNLAGKPVPLTLSEFLSDTQGIGQGLVVGAPGWEVTLENNKRAFVNAFVTRTRFLTRYPNSLTPEAYVDALNANAGGVLSQTERDALVADLKSAAKTRAEVLRTVAEHQAVVRREFNQAFVLMQYFGYLRRNPDDAPELNRDFAGYNFWLGKLNEFNGNYIQAEMVKAFITSDEYRKRFGQ
jgi:CSLREA domain-containing protein